MIKRTDINLSSVDRVNVYRQNLEQIILECIDIMASKKEKTLIVLYKTIAFERQHYKFREDFENRIKELYHGDEYTITHFGEYTTGVNHLLDNRRVIFIGMLNKSQPYYQNKSYAITDAITGDSSLMREQTSVEINDYLISTIQQIGRTAFRINELVEVYLLCKLSLGDTLINELGKYFNVTKGKFINSHYYQKPNKQGQLAHRITDFIESRNLYAGAIIKKETILQFCDDVQIDKSILRKPEFKEMLELEYGISLLNNPKNAREYVLK